MGVVSHISRSRNSALVEWRLTRGCATNIECPMRGGRNVILFVPANPIDNSPLALEEECAAIERELRMTEGRDDFDFRSKWATTCDDMMRHLNDLRPTIIHFSGLGGSTSGGHSESALQHDRRDAAWSDNGAHIQDGRGQRQCLDPRGLKMMIQAAATSSRVVVLNACYGVEHADELRTVVDCVVGMTGAIGDAAARSFAAAFYRALGSRRSVANAVEQASAVLAAEQIRDEHLPWRRTRNGVDATQVFLSEPGIGPPDRAAVRHASPCAASPPHSPVTPDARHVSGDTPSWGASRPPGIGGRGRCLEETWSRRRRHAHR